jgi:hypothetical protein
MGHGVSLTHLNGRTLADMVLGKKTDLTEVFFVNRNALPWPPEPVRTMSAKAILAAMKCQDRNPTAASAPFGGIKESGVGREGATEGIFEYLETKLGGFAV